MVNKRARTNKTYRSKALVTNSTKSGAIVGSNDNLLTEILRRLPVTSILRFKSVSKHWQSLLSHRHFTLLYDNVPVTPGLFVRDLYISFDVKNPTPPPFRSLNFHPDPCGIKIMQSCNGLFLCCSNRGKEPTRKYYVFNPTTKQFAVIPSVIGGPDASKTIRSMVLAFHPVDYVPYKVVCFRNVHPNGNLFEIQIYSSDTGKWRISHDSSYMRSFGYGVYWNGAVHWIRYGSKLVYFKLHLVNHENPLQLNVYEMLSDYSDWFVKYRVELDNLPAAYDHTVYSNHDASKYQVEVVDVVRGEDEESTFMVVRARGKIIMYNVVNKSFKQIFDLPSCYRRICTANFHRYTQNISSF